MTTPAVDITIPDSSTNSLKLGPSNRQGELTFTVKNVLPRSLQGIVELIFAPGTEKPAWLTVPPKVEFDVNETVPIKVTAKLGGAGPAAPPAGPPAPGAAPAALPAGTKPGKYTFRLRVSDKELTNDVYTESRPVTIEVEDRVVTPPPKWLIPVIIGGLVLIAGVVILVIKLSHSGGGGKKDLGEACTADAECTKGATCEGEGDRKVCLMGDGGNCKKDDDCSSGTCDKTCSSATVGQACGANFKCPKHELCDRNKTNTCQGETGFKGCKKADDCVTNNCIDGTCRYPDPGADCGAGKACPPNQVCTSLQKEAGVGNGNGVCLLKAKEDCDRNQDCNSFQCRNKRCMRNDLGCDVTADCPDGLKCANKKCVIATGNKCDHPGLADQLCEQGFCSGKGIDKGKCVDSNCRDKCNPERERCWGETCIPTNVSQPPPPVRVDRPSNLREYIRASPALRAPG